MIDLRFNDKNNIKRIQCSRKDDVLLNIITDDYVPIEIIYVNYIDLYNRKNDVFTGILDFICSIRC